MPAMPFPCAKAEAVAAMTSAAERICFSVFQDVLVHKLFLFFAVKRVDGPLSGG